MDTQDTQIGAEVAQAGGHDNKRVIVSLVVVVAILIVGYMLFWAGSDVYREPGLKGESEVIYTDLNSETVSKIPAGFPTAVPVEEQNIKESYKINYFDEGITQYTLAFNTDLGQEEIWKLYSDMFLAVGYTQDSDKTSEDKGVLTGWRSGNKLHITISKYDSQRYVTINFIERQVSVE